MSEKSLADWQTTATELSIEGRAFINGRCMDALSGATRPTNNPANSQPLTDVAVCGIEDAEQAVKKARAAF
ncbi:MAG: aldehyde dehydrogenase PuuC, partial [Gammaproteobacteria bacterium]|nr:aldehyde dehydrogenase PuuC [Gammaproteobacteria bacterium]